MDKKKFKYFLRVYFVNLLIIVTGVIVMVLASEEIIPSVFQQIGLILVLMDIIGFGVFSRNYRQR